MADEALEPPSLNPFDSIAENDNKPVAAPKSANPFDSVGPELKDDTSATGSFVRALGRAVLPSVAAFPAIGAGAEAGAFLGAFGGPAAPVTVPLGALAGGVAAGFGASWAASAAQDYAIEKLPDTWQEAIGQDQRQRKLDEEKHGTAAFLGGLVPTVLTMRPGLPAKVALPENATGLQRIMANPATAVVFGGGVMGGMELGTQIAAGHPPNWTHVAVATGVGVVFNRTTPFGERLIELGARRARAELGQPEPGAAAAPEAANRAPEAAPEPFERSPTGYLTPEQAGALDQGIPVEQVRPVSEVPEFPGSRPDFDLKKVPTVIQAADAKVMGPGVTESVFMGTQEQTPAAAMSSHQSLRNEKIMLGEPAEAPDIRRMTRQMEPELLDRYEALRAQQDDFRRWEAESEAAGLPSPAGQHLRAVEAELDAIQPQLTAAYRRAADAVGNEVVEPIGKSADVSRETIRLYRGEGKGGAGLPGKAAFEGSPTTGGWFTTNLEKAKRYGDVSFVDVNRDDLMHFIQGHGGPDEFVTDNPKFREQTKLLAKAERPLAEQRQFIVDDVVKQLMTAGRPEEEARAAAALIAARVQTRSQRMGGLIGSPEELYLREGASIRGGKGTQPLEVPVGARELAQIDWTPGGGSKTVQIGNTTIDYGVARDGKSAEIILVKTPEAQRGEGSARTAMEAMTAAADAHGTTLFLNSDPMGNGVRKSGLDDFYKSLGFVKNTGKNKDFTSRAEFVRQPEEVKELEQSARGKIRIAEGRKPIITLMKEANPSTFIHETGHQWLEEVMRDALHPQAPPIIRDDADIVQRWLGVHSADDIKTKHHEKFARGFEQYMREGVAPSPGLAGVFARFKDWLLSIYQTLKGLGAPINEEVRGVFDRMLAMEPQRTVVAPEREPTGPTIHDIHETEAQHVTPVEAGPAADRIAAETDRFAAELPPEVKRELETEIAKIEPPAEAEADAGAKPAGETGAGAGEGPEVGPGSGQPGALTAGGAGGEESGAVSKSGGSASAESPVSRADFDTGNPLAPGPTRVFGAEQSPHLDKAGNIRLDTLTTVEEARQAIRDAAAANQDFIGDRRGVVTDGQVMDVARAAGMEGAERLVASRIRGQAFSAEEVMTLRLALVQSATDVATTMKKAAAGSDADVMAYAAAKDRHQLLQATVAQATAEAGRALRAFRNITGMTGEAANADLFMRQATGKTLFQLRQEARLGATLDTPEAVSKFIADSQKRSFGRMMLEFWINGLLSGPATHSTAAIGTTILSLQHHVPETAVAALIGAARKRLGREGEVVRIGEIGARLKGAGEGFAPAVKSAGESFAAGTNTLLPGEKPHSQAFQVGHENAPRPVLDESATLNKIVGDTFAGVQGIRDGIVSTAALVQAGGEAGASFIGAKYSLTGAIPDIAIKGVTVLPLGTAARLPGRLLTTADSFFRAVNYSAEKNARAYRMASEEGLTGKAFDARVAEIRANPPEAMMAEIVEEAQRLSVMESGGKLLQALTHASNVEIGGFPALKFVTPFVRVAGNILRQTAIERMPFGLLSPEIRADLMGKNGTVAADTAAARMLVGTALSVGVGTLAAEGYISGSGPSDPKEAAVWRLAGNQAHSVRIGDTWYGVEKLGPLGMLTSIAADLYEVSKTANEGELEQAAGKLIHAFSQNILDQSMMKGPADLLKAIQDPDRYGDKYVSNFLSSFVPFSVGMSQLAKQSDPYTREARTTVDAIRARIPGHLDNWFENPLLPKRDLWGAPVLARETWGGAGITSIAQKQVSTDPVNLALLQLNINQGPVRRTIRNVELTDQQFDYFAATAGAMTKARLDVIVNSPDWNSWPNYVRVLVINETFKQSREVARGMVMARWPQIVKDATESRLDKFRD